jgi:hypothetical protein
MGCWGLDFLMMQHGGCCDGAQHYQAIAGGYGELESSCCLHYWSVYRKRGFCHSRPSIRNQWVQLCLDRIFGCLLLCWKHQDLIDNQYLSMILLYFGNGCSCLLQIRWWRLLRTLGGFSWYVLLNVLNCLWYWSSYRFRILFIHYSLGPNITLQI